MPGQSHSYLDLSVIPEVAAHILSPKPVILVAGTQDSILWANAAGAQLFGGKGIVQLLAATLNNRQSFTNQLQSAIAQMDQSSRLTRGFRLNNGEHSMLLQFEINRLDLADGSMAYLVENLNDIPADLVTETKLAEEAVNALDGFADAAAILDGYGLVLAATSEFSAIGPSTNTCLLYTSPSPRDA